MNIRLWTTMTTACIVAMAGFATEAESTETVQAERIVRIADGAPNRIVTPYENPKFITNFPHEAWSVGSVIYILPMEESASFGGFVQDETGEFAIPVMFETARIPPQTIQLEDPSYEPVAPGETAPKKTADHISNVVETLMDAMKETQIPGFRQVRVDNRVIYVGPIRMELIQAQRRGDIVVERHAIVNDGDEVRSVSEASFVANNRLGVLVYPPMTEMAPGQEASVFIMRRQ